MSDDGSLQAKARAAIEAGDLPRRSPDKVWGGPATGARCAICGTSTTPGDIELELEFTRDPESGRAGYSAHPHCFSIFTRELEHRD
jgi:hypothetical protein